MTPQCKSIQFEKAIKCLLITNLELYGNNGTRPSNAQNCIPSEIQAKPNK